MTKVKKVQTTLPFSWQIGVHVTVCRRDIGRLQYLNADCSTVTDAQVDTWHHVHSHRISDAGHGGFSCFTKLNTTRKVCILHFNRRQQFFVRKSKTRVATSYHLTDWHGTSWTLSTNERQASKDRLADGRRVDSSGSCLAAGGSVLRSAGDRATKCLARFHHFGSAADPPGIGREIQRR